MNITAVSTDDKQLAELARLLRARSNGDVVSLFSGTTERLFASSDIAAADAIVIAQPELSPAELDRIEHLGFMAPNSAMILVSPLQTPELLMQAMRAGVREVVPWPPAGPALYQALRRIADKRASRSQASGKVIAFVSCKGGSGATFLATNLAYSLATLENKRVALFDLNLQFGDATLFVSEQKPLATLADVARQIHRLDPTFLAGGMVNVTPNYGILAAPENPAQSEDVKPEHIDALLKLARRHYDFIFLDIGRTIDAVSVRALDQADIIYLVLQTTLPYIRDGKRLLEVFRTLDYDKQKISLIVNRLEKNGQITLRDLEGAYGTDSFVTVPNHYDAAAASVNQGMPIQKLAPGSPVSKALAELARSLARPADTDSRTGWLARLLRA